MFNANLAYQENLLSKAHHDLGHEVTIIAPSYCDFDKKTNKIINTSKKYETIGGGIKVIRLKPVFPLKINQSLHCFYGLGKTIEEIEPDLIFAHGLVSLNFRYFSHYKRKHPEVKIVYDNHADFNNSCKNKFTYIYNRYIVRNFLVSKIENTSDFFYGVTPARCDFLSDMYGLPKQKISLLPMGADETEMHFDRRKEIRQEVREKYGIENDDFLIVTGGRIDPLKNIHVLAKAVKDSQYKKVKILVFGSIRKDMQGIFDVLQSDNRIICVGWQPSNQVYRFFYAADIVMFPGLHSVLWEQAVASQVPCAFSRINGFEHVDIGGNCILMDRKSSSYYQSVVERVYTDKTYYHNLCDNARSEKSQQFLYRNIAKKVIADVCDKDVE